MDNNEKSEPKVIVSDHTARCVLDMAKHFYSNPENVKYYEKWHLEEYGCLPEGSEK